MIDSIYRKNQNYYLKVFLDKEIYYNNSDEEYYEKCINLFSENSFEDLKFHFPKYKEFFKGGFFLFS